MDNAKSTDGVRAAAPTQARRTLLGTLLGVALLLVAPPFASAGSFFVEEQSVAATGRAFAGESALSDDASAIFYNPASVVGYTAPRITLGNYALSIRSDYDDRGTRAVTPGTLGASVPVSGDDGGNPFGVTALAGFSASAPLPVESRGSGGGQRWWVGLNAVTPFALQSRFGESWFGRYNSTKAQILTVDVSPTFGYAITDRLAIGASVGARYAKVIFENALPDPVVPGGPTAATDGEFQVKGDDWDAGYTVGVRWQPFASTSLGAAYRSRNSVALDGHAQFSEFRGLASVINGRQGSTVKFELPDIVFIGLAQELTPRLTLLAQYNWYNWSLFDEVRVELPGGARLTSPQNYHDSKTVSAGLEFQWSDRLTLRTGAEFDETPVDQNIVSTTTPDNDRYRVSCGLSYRVRPNMTLDFAYSHVFVQEAKIDRTDPSFVGTPFASEVQTRARANSSADVVGAAIRISF